MSRKETIMIAVLVNAALLTVLFVTAIRSDPSTTESSSKLDKKTEQLAERSHKQKSNLDDDFLNEYIVSIPKESSVEQYYTFDEGELALVPMPLPNPATDSASQSPPNLATKPSEPVTGHEMKKEEERLVNVTVKKGDVLEKIARANQTTVAAIMKANHLTSSQLKIGQVLKIPLPKEGVMQGAAVTHEGEYYIVREGDNPWLIASRNKINLEELLRLNDLDEIKAKRLRPGDRLKIR